MGQAMNVMVEQDPEERILGGGIWTFTYKLNVLE
jgi:hypothetical protein